MKGGEFLFASQAPECVFTPEDFTDEHRAIAKTTDEFWAKEVAPNLEAILHQDFAVLRKVVRKAGELGLTAAFVPEKFGGMEMDLASMMVVAQGIARDGSYAAWHGAQTGIGALPVLLFGTEAAEGKISAAPGVRRVVGGLCADRAACRDRMLWRAKLARIFPPMGRTTS